MRFTEQNGDLTVYLEGEIDHHTAKALREAADEALMRRRPRTLVLDFSGVTFMDSSGVGLVMGRYKKAEALGCRITVQGMRAREARILALSGLPQLVEFRAAPPQAAVPRNDNAESRRTL